MHHPIETPFGYPGYLVLSGSRLYGIDTPESDYDYLGAIVEPMRYRIGLEKNGTQHGFEQHVFKGDNYEGTVYSLWKLAQMFAEGNPTSLCLLFANPIVDVHRINSDRFRKLVMSKKSGHRFLKYMEAQKKSMTGERASHTKRPDLVSRDGYDTKFAGHLLRLGYQGCEFLETGNITLPMPDDGGRLNVLDVRAGQWTMKEVLDEAQALEARANRALTKSTLPEEADYARLNDWLEWEYLHEWGLEYGPNWD